MNPFFFRLTIGATASLILGLNVTGAPLTWFPGPPLNTQISGAATTVVGGYGNVLIGGDAYFTEYLIATNASWGNLTGISPAHIGGGAAGSGDPIVVFGGTDGTTPQSTATAYSPSGDTVPTYPPMSVARGYLGYTSDNNGNGYAIGGLDASGHVLSSAEVFGGDSNTWSGIAAMPLARYDFPAAYDGTDYIYVFGGYTSTNGAQTATAYRYSISGNQWTQMASMPTAVAGSAAAFGADGKIYVVGGVSNGVTVTIVQMYDPASNSWTITTPLPEGLSAAAMGVDSLGRLLLMGGKDTNGNDVADVWRSQLLGTPDSAPVLTQYPGTNANYGVVYTSSIAATGNPQPTFLVITGPTNLTVDTYSGVIKWTPQGSNEIGEIPVTIRATNYAGYADWSFIIHAAPPPPVIPTNLTVVGVTDTSISLAWAPENPLVGSVTYKVGEWHPYLHGGGVYVVVASNLTDPSATISGLQPGTHHNYGAAATVNGGTTTGYSAQAGAFTTSPQPPQTPQVTSITSSTISFGWMPSPGPAQNPSYSSITSYSISQYIPGGTVNPKVTGITGTSGAVTGITPGTAAFWVIQSHDADGFSSSASVNILTVSNPVPTPAVLSGLAPSGTGGLQFTVQNAAAETTYVQSTTNLGDPTSWVTIATNPPGTSVLFTDTNIESSSMLFYRVVSP